MARPEKAAKVSELGQKFTDSAAVVLTEYRGLTVKDLQDLRRSLGDGATYAVAKNTLALLAAREVGSVGTPPTPLRRTPWPCSRPGKLVSTASSRRSSDPPRSPSSPATSPR